MGVLTTAGKCGVKAASPTKDTAAAGEPAPDFTRGGFAAQKEGRGLPALLALRWSGN
jgi:hypothetical protein